MDGWWWMMADGGCFLSTSKKGTRHETDINVTLLELIPSRGQPNLNSM
jgi:hypothetical protein